MTSTGRRVVYVLCGVVVLLLWLKLGIFAAIEAPYVGF
jgi:hypothetical protein